MTILVVGLGRTVIGEAEFSTEDMSQDIMCGIIVDTIICAIGIGDKMLDAIIVVCAIFGLAFLLKESDGPWGLISRARNLLLTNKHVGVFFFKLLDCYFCLGFHCGWITYLLHESHYSVQFFILWGLAGGMISLTFNSLLSKLSSGHD